MSEMSAHEPNLLIEVKKEGEDDLIQDPAPESSAPKRRYVLVSRKIVALNGQPRTLIPPNVPIRRPRYVQNSAPYAVAPAHHLNISHRICLICQIIKPISQMILVTDQNDKLFLILLGISRKKIEVTSSNNTYKQSPFFSCRSHFSEASAQVLHLFGVPNASRIHASHRQKVSQVEMFARHVTRNTMLNVCALFSSAYTFITKHPEEAVGDVTLTKLNVAPVGPIVKEEDIPYEKTVECKAVVNSDAIVPKCFRQPRKQRFEKEENDCISSMLRIIRREPLNLPTDHAPYPVVALHKPFKCCYCLEIHEKEMMLHVPKTKGRIALWTQHLGEEFGEILKMNTVHYMCRKHFSKLDLSPSGRLRRNAMPNFVPRPEIHTFKIYGDQFVKVEEHQIKVEHGENSDIDIEN